MADRLNPKSFAIALAIMVFVFYVIGFIGVGFAGMYGRMGYMMGGAYGGWSFGFFGLIGAVVSAFIFGYIFAWLYNWASKEFK